MSLLVRPQLKRQIEKLAAASGTTLAAEAERLLQAALDINDTLAALRMDSAQLAKAAFRRHHVPIHTPHGDIWYPKDHPDAPKVGGFIPPEGEAP
jgi:hypothetical protein